MLTVPGAIAADQLGFAGGQGVKLADVTGDGVLDVVAAASFANVGGVADVGAVYVWKGGATLVGTPSPTATLTVPGALASDELGFAPGQGVQLGDVTGDGILDVVAAADLTDVGGVKDTGAICVWKGGATLVGALSPTATLTVPGAIASDRLGLASGQSVQLEDVSGDGVLDVVAAAQLADVGGVGNAGAVYVWKGGGTLVGAPSPTATLTIPGAIPSDQLGAAAVQSVQLGDVTGDGTLDVVAGAVPADVGGVVDAGAIYVWQGGATLVGAPSPTATLTVPFAFPGDQLGFAGGQGVQLGDVTGDGVLDVVGAAKLVGADKGAIYVWKGGATLAGALSPTATLAVPGAVASDQLGFASGQGVQLGDVTGDGILDVVAGAQGADVGGFVDTGAIYVWKGGATLVGELPPTATLTVSGAIAFDQLGLAAGQGVQLGDVTGDGILDVVGAAKLADVGGVADTGAVYVWKGGATLVGAPSPTATLTVPGAITLDEVGLAAGQGVQLGDVTGDGILDVVASAAAADVGGVADTGAVYVWKGGATLVGAPPPTATLTVPGAIAFDQLGLATGQAVQLGDVTGDGILDVVGAAAAADVGGVVDTGAVYVWKGGATLAGALPPSATFVVPGAVASDHLGN